MHGLGRESPGDDMSIPPRRRAYRWPSYKPTAHFIAEIAIVVGLIALLIWIFT